jgi:1-acyl-sn-glycerol-3-phosphate acyltransferase
VKDFDPKAGWVYHIVDWVARWCFRLFFRVRVEGLENIPPDQPFLIVANHRSFLDPPLAVCFLRRKIAILARGSLFRFGPFGRFLKILGSIPLERGAPDRQALLLGTQALEKGAPLLIFPEGTRNTGPGLLPFQRGFLLMPKKTGKPIVLAALRGTGRALPKGSFFPRIFRRVSIHYSEPISAEEVLNLGADGLRLRLLQMLGEPDSPSSGK